MNLLKNNTRPVAGRTFLRPGQTHPLAADRQSVGGAGVSALQVMGWGGREGEKRHHRPRRPDRLVTHTVAGRLAVVLPNPSRPEIRNLHCRSLRKWRREQRTAHEAARPPLPKSSDRLESKWWGGAELGFGTTGWKQERSEPTRSPLYSNPPHSSPHLDHHNSGK